MARGVWEMIRARRALARIGPADIARLNAAAAAAAARPGGRVPHRYATARVAFIINLLGRVLPWRSDCLIQALAAQNWLAAMGIAAQIRIGVERTEPGGFGAHAWLVHNGEVLTGGKVDRYAILIGESDPPPPGPQPQPQAGPQQEPDASARRS